MHITHSDLHREMTSFWFRTAVDDAPRFETVVDSFNSEWATSASDPDGPVVLRGQFSGDLSGPDSAAEVKSILEAAIQAGRV
jgi:hypothetical protein